jgi:hypothetical protein
MNNSRTLVDSKIAKRMHEICNDSWLKERFARFVVVVHGWHVTSKGFNVHEIEVESMEEAMGRAEEIRKGRDKVFDKCAAVVIPIYNKETIKKPVTGRRLTLMERITGKIKQL